MGKVIFLLMLSLSFSFGDVFETVFYGNCASCHNRKDDSSGPLITEILKVYKQKYPIKKDFKEAIYNWLKKPTVYKSLFKDAIKRYGLMPKIELDKESAKGIARYLGELKIKN